MARDQENDFKLMALDWIPIHFWGQEIQKHTKECVEAVEDLIFELRMSQFDVMKISEQIKVLCIRCNISVAELARRMGTTPQNFNSKMKREGFTIADLEYLAETLGCSFERYFVLPDGEKG